MNAREDEIDKRLRVIEKLVWTAVGGIAVIGVITMVGIGILLDQAKRIDAVALRQAAAIAERIAHEDNMKAEIARLRDKMQ